MESYASKAYEATAHALGFAVDNIPDDDRPLVMLYTLLTLVRGADVTPGDVHDAWALWTVVVRDRRGHHPSLVPFDDLPDDVKALDDFYVEAIVLASEAR